MEKSDSALSGTAVIEITISVYPVVIAWSIVLSLCVAAELRCVCVVLTCGLDADSVGILRI